MGNGIIFVETGVYAGLLKFIQEERVERGAKSTMKLCWWIPSNGLLQCWPILLSQLPQGPLKIQSELLAAGLAPPYLEMSLSQLPPTHPFSVFTCSHTQAYWQSGSMWREGLSNCMLSIQLITSTHYSNNLTSGNSFPYHREASF